MIRLQNDPGERIAIIGSGVSGLVCAHELHRRRRITMFEAGPRVGGHVHTVDVDVDGDRQSIDTGFIVYNELNYPNFTRILRELDVPTHASEMSFSVRCDRTGLEYNGTSLNRLFAQRRNLFRPGFHRMVRDILRFNRESPAVLRDEGPETVAEYVAANHYGDAFMEQYLVPMGASIWSCPPRTFKSFPIRFVVEFFANHRMLDVAGRPQWRVITGGSQRYVDAMTRPFRASIRLATPVRGVRRTSEHVELTTDRGVTETFDHVIFACHSDTALALLQDASPLERELLGAFPYQANEVLLHTDTSVLPRKRRAWAAWNYHRRREDPDAVAITYNMNILQGLRTPNTYCVTLNDAEGIDPNRVIGRYTYHHPVYTSEGRAAQRRVDEVTDVNRTSFCGAYWGYGFHEDGVRSALRVARAYERVAVA